MPIRVLDAATVSKIAAGEMVERPASALKELIENSLDAGARHITVELRNGGIELIRVTDDGCGIEPEQVRMAFENHATSKLQHIGDLVDVATMGFRGEALPSISIVSRLEMTTRARGLDTGTRIELDAGVIKSVEPVNCAEGTTVIVRDLFYNVPARRAFLRKPAQESAAAADLVARLALGRADVAFRLNSNGKQVFRTQGDGNARHAVMAVYDRVTAENMRQLDAEEGTLAIRGLIGVGSSARATRAHEHIYVNGRAVRCPLLSQALEEACKGRVMIGRFPMCVLHVDVPYNAVDVNVHPGKLEVRFRDEAYIYSTAAALLERAFAGENMLTPEQPVAQDRPQPVVIVSNADAAPDTASALQGLAPETRPTQSNCDADSADAQRSPAHIDGAPQHNSAKTPEAYNSESTAAQRPDSFAAKQPLTGAMELSTGLPSGLSVAGDGAARKSPAVLREPAALRAIQPEPAEESQHPPLTLMDAAGIAAPEQDDVNAVKIVGVAFDTYIMVEYRDTLYVIDQHAAHERILYEQFMKQWENGVQSQLLLIPYTVTVSAQEKAQILENRALLHEIGFDVEDFGQYDIQVRAVPLLMGEPDMRPFFTMTAAELRRLKSAPLSARRDAVMQQACKHAIKGGDPLTREEIWALLRQMRETQAPANCPHGRPALIAIPKADIEKRFSRIV